MLQIKCKKLYLSVIISSLILFTSFIIDGIVSYSLAQASTKLDKTLKIQLIENKQLTNRVGRFSLVYKPSSNELHQALQQGLQQAGLFEIIISGLNNSGLVMRYDIPVVFQDCGMGKDGLKFKKSKRKL